MIRWVTIGLDRHLILLLEKGGSQFRMRETVLQRLDPGGGLVGAIW